MPWCFQYHSEIQFPTFRILRNLWKSQFDFFWVSILGVHFGDVLGLILGIHVGGSSSWLYLISVFFSCLLEYCFCTLNHPLGARRISKPNHSSSKGGYSFMKYFFGEKRSGKVFPSGLTLTLFCYRCVSNICPGGWREGDLGGRKIF